MKDNPLLINWKDNDKFPPFNLVKDEHFKPALQYLIDLTLIELDKLADNNEPTFENTILKMDEIFEQIDLATAIYYTWSSSNKSEEFQAIEVDLSGKLSIFNSAIFQNENLFKRIKKLYKSSNLDSEQDRLVTNLYDEFIKNGADLDLADKNKLSYIDKKLSSFFTEFNQNVLKDEEKELIIEDLSGIPDNLRKLFKKEDGEYSVKNTRSSAVLFLTYSDRRDLREKVWNMFVNRGKDNGALIKQILSLRKEKVKLLGFDNHAAYMLKKTMAENSDNVFDLLNKLWEPALKLVENEVNEMQVFIDKDVTKIEPWDYRYYTEKVRELRYNFDKKELIPYLQLDKMCEAMFWVAKKLFNIDFVLCKDVPIFNSDMSVFDVLRDGHNIGIFYFDPFARNGKSSGAWMCTYRDQEDGVLPLVSNNSNFIKGEDPILISWDDTITLFHEFGHALHGLCSDVTYKSLSGTNVCRDFVEFPSQLLERWVSTTEVLERFAIHYETGKPIPQELINKIDMSSKFNQGFELVEYLSCALVDMLYHTTDEDIEDPERFEEEALLKIGMPSEITMRHKSIHFKHIFGCTSYSAGYYSYIWSEILSADAFGAFTEKNDIFNPYIAKSLFSNILSVGDSRDPKESYRAFRGRDPEVDYLMKDKGFTE